MLNLGEGHILDVSDRIEEAAFTREFRLLLKTAGYTVANTPQLTEQLHKAGDMIADVVKQCDPPVALWTAATMVVYVLGTVPEALTKAFFGQSLQFDPKIVEELLSDEGETDT